MTRLASFCFSRSWLVIAVWLVLLAAVGAASAAVGFGYDDDFQAPGTESTRALELLEASFPRQAGDENRIVWSTATGRVTDPAVRERVEPMLRAAARGPRVAAVTSPYSRAGTGQISRDGRIAYATVTMDGEAGTDVPRDAYTALIGTAQAAAGEGLRVELGGRGITFATQAFEGNVGELVGLAAAAVVLFLAFGSLLAMVTPLLTAIAGIGVALSAGGILAHAFPIATFAPTLASLIGLGVGIDYALFIVTRHRNAIKRGDPPSEAVRLALDTSGRAVLFAGVTVCVALMGMAVVGVSFLVGVAVSASLAVLCTVLASVTLLPAILGVLGDRVLSRKERARLAEHGPGDPTGGGAWARWAARVARRPAPLALAAVLLMVVVAIPATNLRLGSADAGTDPPGSTTRGAYDLLADGFGPGFNGPLQVVVRTDGERADLSGLRDALRGTDGVAVASDPVPSPDGRVALLTVVPDTAPQSQRTSELIERLRDDVIPGATDRPVAVGGLTAVFDDFADSLTAALPRFVAVIVVLGCLLLMLAFRSIVVPLIAAGMNLLAAGAAFGVVTLVFQDGVGTSLLGVGEGPIEPFLPVMLLAILFGLSMDYQVFLVSRMHEEWVATRDNHRAVRVGQADTGRVITAAATIMIVVFASFLLLGQRVVSEFAVGLAVGVFLDAFVLRTVLVPALMHLVGPRNWWLPGWLDRVLPHVSVEGRDASRG